LSTRSGCDHLGDFHQWIAATFSLNCGFPAKPN
jgi:hypothetical protein